MISFIQILDILGTFHILHKQTGWVGGLGQLLTFAYKVGRWVKDNDYVSKLLEKTVS